MVLDLTNSQCGVSRRRFMCDWQIKHCDPVVTHGLISERFRDEGLIIKRYINSSVYFLYSLTCQQINKVISVKNSVRKKQQFIDRLNRPKLAKTLHVARSQSVCRIFMQFEGGHPEKFWQSGRPISNGTIELLQF